MLREFGKMSACFRSGDDNESPSAGGDGISNGGLENGVSCGCIRSLKTEACDVSSRAVLTPG
jgi:hypothetical protein